MSLFHHNPPDNQPQLLRDLFVGREWELEQLKERLPGEWSSANIRAIHGESRTGKSHLTLRYLDQLSDSPHHLFIVKAASGRTARQILVELYRQVRNKLTEVEVPADLPDGVSSFPILQGALRRVRLYDGLITGEQQSKELSIKDAQEHGGGLKILAAIFGLTAEFSGATKAQKEQSRKVALSVPDDYHRVDIIRELCEALFFTTDRRCIVYIDDVDLLDAGPYIDQKEVTILLRHLQELAQSKFICVVASLRTRHLSATNKEFEEALRVTTMDDADLRSIYERHIQLFRKGKPLIDERCMEQLLAAATGHIGNFLRWCRKLHDWAGSGKRLTRREADGTQVNRELTVADLEDFIRHELRQLSGRASLTRHMDRISQAVLAKQIFVELEPEVMGTELLYTVLEEPGEAGTPKVFQINPFVARVLRSMAHAVPAGPES